MTLPQDAFFRDQLDLDPNPEWSEGILQTQESYTPADVSTGFEEKLQFFIIGFPWFAVALIFAVLSI
jgi:hypothetical protein